MYRVALIFLALLSGIAFGERRLHFPAADLVAGHFPATARVVAIGDLHADPVALVTILLQLQLIDENGAWIAGGTRLVAMGDILDRGPDSRLCLNILYHLALLARRQGGDVHLILGNHELRVLDGTTDYTSAQDNKGYADFGSGGIVSAMLAANSPFATELGYRNAFLQIGSSIFVHASPGAELLARAPSPEEIRKINTVFRYYVFARQKGVTFSGEWLREVPWLVFDPKTSPLLSRDLSEGRVFADDLDRFHGGLQARRTVVGHVVTRSGRIESILDQRIWMIDTGISSVFRGHGKPSRVMSALEILDDEKVIAHEVKQNWRARLVMENLRFSLPCSVRLYTEPYRADAK